MGQVGVILGPSWGYLEHLGGSLGHLGGILEACSILGCNLGFNFGGLGSKLRGLSAQVGPSWAQVGPSWAKLGPSWDYVGRFEQNIGRHSVRLRHMSPKIIKDGSKEPNISLKTWILERFFGDMWGHLAL